MSEKVFRKLHSECWAIGLTKGLYNAQYTFISELLSRIEKEDKDWDCHFQSEEDNDGQLIIYTGWECASSDKMYAPIKEDNEWIKGTWKEGAH